MKFFINTIKIIFYCIFITGIVGGNYYFYKEFLKKAAVDRYILKGQLISINIDKLLKNEQDYLIKKYKDKVLSNLTDNQILNSPDKIISKDIKQKIANDLKTYRNKLYAILSQLEKKGFIIIKNNSVLAGVSDATDDIKTLLNIDNNKSNIGGKDE